MGIVWTMKLYEMDGTPITGLNYDGLTSNTIKNATDRRMNFVLNGVDTASFAVYLDDPMALEISKFKVIKIWRDVDDDDNDKHYVAPATRPDFAGLITALTKSGQSNIMRVSCQSALWRLQSRFHILNHYLKTDPDTSDPWRQGPLMYHVIKLVDDAFGAGSATGIVEGTHEGTGGPEVAAQFIAKGTNTWSLIMEELLSRPSSVDILPEYYHLDGLQRQLDFSTVTKRGDDISVSGMPWQYNMGESNLLNVEEEGQIVPGEFGNYVWAVGEGGPNSGLVAMEEATTGITGRNNIGIYMKYVDRSGVKTLGTDDPDSDGVKPIAKAELAKSKIPRDKYSVTLSPGIPPYYKVDYNMGDVIRLDAEKGALTIDNLKQRIYEIGLSISDNNMETASVTLADDFTGKVTET